MNFTEKILDVVSKIPKGSVMTYGQVAEAAGNVRASRAVGTIMRNNQDKNIPCHRVVRSDGAVGDYNGLQNNKTGMLGKIELLKKEGVIFDKNNKVNIK